ncbi:hypothetical protein [Embleya hyalina]|uniref:Uncharacterized protein n=1 Tax=Embleya hyalina TaxID=516124 RepID=A0A401YET0_9ACTN|nr:hypothetical protein [Embleya hyalina]GCD93068.1 hypothetical protein EHYA_00711 [Embleya hyalina]
MSTEHTHVRRLLAAVALTLAVLVVESSAPTSGASPRPAPVEATASGTELSVPEAGAVRPGTTTFRVRNVDSAERWIGLARLRPGFAPETFVDRMRRAVHGPAEEGAVARWNEAAEMLGGVSVAAHEARTFTQFLTPGTYYLVDYQSLREADPLGRVRAITVRGAGWHVEVPEADHVVVLYSTPGGTRFHAPARIAPTAKLLVINASGLLEEAMLRRVRPGTTDRDVTDYFLGFGPDPFPPASPPGQGLAPTAPGRSGHTDVELTPGRYVLISWINDYTNTHRIVDVT